MEITKGESFFNTNKQHKPVVTTHGWYSLVLWTYQSTDLVTITCIKKLNTKDFEEFAADRNF